MIFKNCQRPGCIALASRSTCFLFKVISNAMAGAGNKFGWKMSLDAWLGIQRRQEGKNILTNYYAWVWNSAILHVKILVKILCDFEECIVNCNNVCAFRSIYNSFILINSIQAQIFAWIINVLNQIKTESSQNVLLLVIINKQCRGKTLKYFFSLKAPPFCKIKSNFIT